ncbi:MAG: sugar phosphate isomerase/epimerase family protein, partial [Terracidiphilus sp.]
MHTISRRAFNRQMGTLTAAAALAPAGALAEKSRTVHIGHTGITWLNNNQREAIRQIGGFGFYGYETFSQVLEQFDAAGDLDSLLEQNHVPLISGYCTINLTNTSKHSEELAKAVRWARLIKKYHGRIFVLGPNQVNRDSYDYAANKSNIVSMLNEGATAVADEGVTPVLHQHTSTCVETRDETYATLDAVDTNVLKFGPDVGQLTKGGADAVQVVKDYLPLVQHMHLKDYNGKDQHLVGYCPMGQGVVKIPAIL